MNEDKFAQFLDQHRFLLIALEQKEIIKGSQSVITALLRIAFTAGMIAGFVEHMAIGKVGIESDPR